jgi:hypothetical protein
MPRPCLIALVLLCFAAGCGDSDNASVDSAAPPAAESSSDSAPADDPAPTSAYGDDDPETLLAIIDNGGGKPSDDVIAPYADRLDYMEGFCRERRSLLADQVVTGVKLLRDNKGLDYTNLQMARAFSNALTGKLGHNQRCAELFAGVITITTAEE